MAPRKSRSRKTAEVMAQYKEMGDRTAVVRRSPRGNNNSPTSRPRSSSISPNSLELREHRTIAKRPTLKARNPGRRVKGMKERSESNEERHRGGEGKPLSSVRSKLRLEDMTEIPETPPRHEQVFGRKRVFPSKPLDLGPVQDLESSVDGEEESQRPSKKRKSFNTPPRENLNGSRVDGERSGVFEEASMVEERNVSLFQTECDSVGCEDDENIEDELIAPVVPTTPKRKQSSSMATTGGRNGTVLRMMEAPRQLNSQSAELDVIATSSVTISRVIESLNKNLVAEVRDLLISNRREVQAMQDRMTSTLSSDIQDMRNTIDMVVNRLKGNAGVKSAKTSLSAWEQKLNAMTPHADIIFNTNVFARILCINAPLKAVEVFDKFEGVDGKRSVIAMQTLLFSLQPGERKDMYSAGIGLQHSEFLYATVQNTFFNVCSNNFNLFRDESRSSLKESGALDPGNTAASMTRREGENARIKRPDWLKQDFVTLGHINAGRRFLETLNQSRKAKVRKTPGPDDVATHGVVRVYRLLRSHLHQSRDNMRVAFFEGVGYLFTTWSKHVKDTDQSAMSLSFLHDIDTNVLDLKMVHLTSCTKSKDDYMVTSQADAHNKTLLKQMFESWPSMIIVAEHEVHVVSGGGAQRRHSGGEKRTIRKLINLIQVACTVMVEYTRVGSTEQYLRGHRNALQCVMVLAFAFRELCSEFIYCRSEMDDKIPELLQVIAHGFCLKDLMPGDNTQASLLKSRCLRMSEKCFTTLHDHGQEENDSQAVEGAIAQEVDIIKESAALGISSI